MYLKWCRDLSASPVCVLLCLQARATFSGFYILSPFNSFFFFFGFLGPQLNCFGSLSQLLILAATGIYFQQTNCKLPSQHQTTDAHGWQLANKHCGAFSSQWAQYFPQKSMRTETELNREWMSALYWWSGCKHESMWMIIPVCVNCKTFGIL